MIPENVTRILSAFQEKGYQAYLVGGCTRDLLLRQPIEEWDITTSATPEEVTTLFTQITSNTQGTAAVAGTPTSHLTPTVRVIPTGIQHGTVTLLFPDGQYEVTTFRKEGKYSDARHPDEVVFTKDIHEDLKRRDFTMNAIAYNSLTNEWIDDFYGKKDLEAKLIRAVGEPVERFSEDGLRPIRACRFAAKLNFQIEEKTLAAIGQSLESVKKVAKERIHDELLKMLKAPKPSVGLEAMRTSGLLPLTLPELMEGYGVEQNPFHAYDVYYHSLHTCDNLPLEKPILRLAGLLHDIGKPRCKQGPHFYGHEKEGTLMAKALLRRLKFSDADTEYICHLILHHLFDYQAEWKDNAVRRFIRRIGLGNIDDLFLLRRGDVGAMGKEPQLENLVALQKRINKILSEAHAFSIKDLAIDGKTVMDVKGIPPGRLVGEILHFLLESVTDHPEWNTPEKLRNLVRSYRSHEKIPY